MCKPGVCCIVVAAAIEKDTVLEDLDDRSPDWSGCPETVVLREVVAGFRAGRSSVYADDVQDATGLTLRQVEAAAAALVRAGLVQVVGSEHFPVLRFVGVSDVAGAVVALPEARRPA